MTPLEIRRMDGAGAVVTGCDISSMTIGDINQIEAAFASFGLLVLRDQAATASELVEFAARWVPRTARPRPELRCETSTTAAVTPGAWHAVDIATSSPPAGEFTLFRSGTSDVPDCRFASAYAAWDALATSTQRALEGLTCLHEASPDGNVRVAHPMVIRHPISGRTVHFIDPSASIGIEGMSDEASLALLNELFEHGQREEFVGSVTWEPGTAVLWDTRAMWQLDPGTPSQTSTFERVTIPGEPLRSAVKVDRSDPTFVQRAGATLAGGILTAAMNGIAEVIEPERIRPDIEIVSEAPDTEPLTGLDFGDLPPLD